MFDFECQGDLPLFCFESWISDFCSSTLTTQQVTIGYGMCTDHCSIRARHFLVVQRHGTMWSSWCRITKLLRYCFRGNTSFVWMNFPQYTGNEFLIQNFFAQYLFLYFFINPFRSMEALVHGFESNRIFFNSSLHKIHWDIQIPILYIKQCLHSMFFKYRIAWRKLSS